MFKIVNSRNKGAVGEREWASILREQGYDARRGQQFSGANGDADVLGVDGIHFEIKRVEKLNIDTAMEQSIRDARDGEMPVVTHRKNRKDWLVTMKADDWFKLLKVWEKDKEL